MVPTGSSQTRTETDERAFRIFAEELATVAHDAFMRCEMNEDDASAVAGTLVQADLRGTYSHGVILSSANAVCERLLGSLRRECLDFLIPLGEEHLRRTLRAWRLHYNRGRRHSSLGPGLPEPSATLPVTPISRHRLPRDARVVARSILGGLHHEYGLEKLAA